MQDNIIAVNVANAVSITLMAALGAVVLSLIRKAVKPPVAPADTAA